MKGRALKVKGEPATVDKDESAEMVLEALQLEFNKLLPEPQPSPNICPRTNFTNNPARAHVFGTPASETASHSSQSERLFLSRIATGHPWALAKNRTFGRPTRRPSDAVAGAITPLLTSTCVAGVN